MQKHNTGFAEKFPRPLFLFLQLFWGFPQTLLGFLLYLRYFHAPHSRYRGAVLTKWRRTSGVSLGLFLFVPENLPQLSAHEYGHSLQSLLLGPLYLPLIGLPSLLWANLPYFRKRRQKKQLDYTSFYSEKWAERWKL